MASVIVEGLRIGYDRSGAGPELVFLHGFTHDARVWRRQLAGLADRFTVVAWDAPGAGRSDDPPETSGLDTIADRLARFLDAIGIGRAVLIGLSWGGILAQETVRRHPGRVRALVLADTYAGWKGSLPASVVEERLEACLADAALPPDVLTARYLPGMLSEAAGADIRAELAAIMADVHPLGFRMMARTSAATDTRDLLPRIDVPTMLVWGDADARSPLSVAERFRDAMPAARFEVIRGAGHVSNVEAPDRFDELVRDFCGSLP